jgi:hypothetical protein
MAAAALNDKSTCIHEPLRYADAWEDVFDDVWAQHEVQYVGASDHGLGFHLPAIMARIAPRTLVINRPVEEVNASLARLGLPASNICELLAEVLAACHHPNIMRVRYADLASSDVVMRCLLHLMPEAKLSWSRIRTLQRLNIQAMNITEVIGEGIKRGRGGDMAALIPEHILRRIRLD